MYKFTFFLLALLPLVAAPAHATVSSVSDCTLRIESGSGQWVVTGYNPFGSVPATGDFDALFVNDGQGPCVFTVSTDLAGDQFGLSQQQVGQRVSYNLIDVLSGDDLTPQSGHSRQVVTKRQFVVNSHSQQIVKLHFQSNELFSNDGTYQQRIFLQAVDANGQLLSQRSFTVGVQIEPQALIGLSGGFRRVNGVADVDLGILSSGVVDTPLMLQVRSTRAYAITTESTHGGKLQLDSGNWSIPYTLLIGGRSVSPDGGSYAAVTANNSVFDRIPLAFDIGDTSRHAAGRYSDTVTLTVSVR